jgi:hypothetical protein
MKHISIIIIIFAFITALWQATLLEKPKRYEMFSEKLYLNAMQFMLFFGRLVSTK